MPDHEFLDIGGPTRVRAGVDPDAPPTLSDDAYPAVFLDQRHGYGVETADEVLAYQIAWCLEHSGKSPKRDPLGRHVTPHLNASRWVADCPECGASNWVWDRNPNMVCLGQGCALSFEVDWQLPSERAAVMRVLAGWPPGNRSWDAHKGETLEELKIQSVLCAGVPALERNGLLVAENVRLPDDLAHPQDYLDRLRTARIKAARSAR